MAARLPWQQNAAKPIPASGIAMVLVLSLVAVGALVLWHREDADLQFAHALPAYRQITGDDVRSKQGIAESGVIGRYTTRPVEEGEVLHVDDLGPQLTDKTLNQDSVIILPTLSRLAPVVHPGDFLMLRVIGAPIRICPIRVLDVKSSEEGADRVIAALPAAEAARLGTVKEQNLLVALRVWGYAQGITQPSVDKLCR